MGRDVGVKDVQEAIAILQAWANDEVHCQDWAVGLIKEMAMLIETLLCNRDHELN